jgi:hypothetical protein
MSDQEDFERLSRRLAGTDFSADSRIRASLRAKLLRRGPRSLPVRVAPLAFAFAAAALVVLFPLRERLRRTEEVRVTVQAPLPPASAPAPTAQIASREKSPARPAFPRGELGLPILPGRLIAGAGAGEEPPISTAAVDHLIEVHRGRVVASEKGSAVVWEIDGTAYILETRRTSLEEIFETRAL